MSWAMSSTAPDRVSALVAQRESLIREMDELRRQTTREILDRSALVESISIQIAHLNAQRTPPPEVVSLSTHAQLQAPADAATVGHMARRPVPRTGPPHPLRLAVGNVAQWAAENGASYSAAKSWMRDDAYGRKIPRYFADLLRRTHKIPYSAWKKGITDEPNPRKGRRTDVEHAEVMAAK